MFIFGYDRYLFFFFIFDGGKFELLKYFMFEKEEIIEKYNFLIILSDELINEILGKFGVYFFRIGIIFWNFEEIVEEMLK